jgi:RND family efflux transporter MFP subunit
MSPDKDTLNELRINRSAPSRRQLSPALVWAALIVAVVVGAIIWWLNRPKPIPVRTVVVLDTATGSNGERTLLNASGYVTARREATVSSKVTGKVMEVLVEEGMKVEAGQILARLDASNVEKSLHLANAQADSARKMLDETKANLEQAEREFQRIEKLAANQVSSASELDRARADARSLRARLERQQADVAVADRQIAVWNQQLEDTVIRAPFAGIVTSKNAQPGEMISPMSAGGFTRTGICTMVDMSSLEVEVDVNESYINRVKSGQPVEATLDSYPDWHIPSKVIAIIPTADRQKATVKVRVGFEKLDPRILPQMSVKVAFQGASEPTSSARRNPTIPKTGVRKDDGRDVVWVVKDGRVERRAVTVVPSGDDEVAIVAGLGSGEKVVIEGADKLANGIRVTEVKQ